MDRASHRESGFTIIELMLAMAFVSVLLLAIALTAIQVGRLYNRGMVLKSINQAGRDISDTMRRDFLQTNGNKMVTDGDKIVLHINEGQASSGRFCLGNYSYVWNTASTIDNPEAVTNNGAVVYDTENMPINFVRVVDQNASLCQKTNGRYPNALQDSSKATQLLKTQSGQSDIVLSIHSLNIKPITHDSTGEGLYEITFMIGTSKQSEINTANQTCKPPSDNKANMEFCAINQFNMIVRTNG